MLGVGEWREVVTPAGDRRALVSRLELCMCAVCEFLHSSVQLGVVFCVHLVFLEDNILQKPMQKHIMPKLFPHIIRVGTDLHFWK